VQKSKVAALVALLFFFARAQAHEQERAQERAQEREREREQRCVVNLL